MINKDKLIALTLPALIVLITITSVNDWSKLKVNTVIVWFIYIITIVVVLWYKWKFFKKNDSFSILRLYFLWVFIGIIRGVGVVNGYWEWKQFFSGVFALCLPVFIYVFSVPWLLSNTLKIWLKYGLILFYFVYSWLAHKGVYQFFLGPVFIIACFLPIVPTRKWKVILFFTLLLLVVSGIDARSQVIKPLVALLVSAGYIWSRYISEKVLKLAFWLLVFTPIILLYLGISGQFNIFRDIGSDKRNYMGGDNTERRLDINDATIDTRTFIYEEVILSAIEHDYWLIGRTPARGNDSKIFGKEQARVLGTSKFERHKNEVCFPNIFTWLGLVGVILYCAIYLKSAYLAVYRSNSLFLKLAGVFVAFHFTFGWVEDINNFDILSISIWMMIAMGISSDFRNMTDAEFKKWFQTIF
ncbi:hypothetical protein [Wenyingzhuangia sp. IMCC45574]